MNQFTLHLGDCLEALRGMADCSVDAVVTDPPYGLSFMGKKWDYDVPGTDVWAECLRVLKPGGHLLAFAGTRTQHRMAVRIEDAGFEIRDMIAWVYGSGFPKSLDVSKAIDKAAGAEREVVGIGSRHGGGNNIKGGSLHAASARVVDQHGQGLITAPATDAARQWQGWGTALKPALEPITVARKPLVGTVAANVLEHGTGALNIDACRVQYAGTEDAAAAAAAAAAEIRGAQATRNTEGWGMRSQEIDRNEYMKGSAGLGRWPANLIHDGSDEVLAGFPDTGKSTGGGKKNGDKFGGGYAPPGDEAIGFGDTGSAARYFYCAKASRSDRGAENTHPTVKPTDLMAYLCRLVTPPGGTVLDPFMGSGSTGKAAMREGFNFIGCELSEEYLAIARARIEHELAKRAPPATTSPQAGLFAGAA